MKILYELLIVSFISMLSTIPMKSELIREDRAWKYEVRYGDEFDSDHLYELLTVRFTHTEIINGKEYYYLVGHTDERIRNATFNDVTNCGFLKFGDVYFYSVPGENLWWDNYYSFYRLFLMREENGKVYVYNDKTYRYTVPFKTQRICFALDKQPEGMPNEFLVYDFNAKVGDEYDTLIFNAEGIPQIANVLIEEINGDTADRKIRLGTEILRVDKVAPERGSSSFFLAGLCLYPAHGSLRGIYNDRNEFVTDWFSYLNPKKEQDIIYRHTFENTLCDTGYGTTIFSYEILSPSDNEHPSYHRFCQVKKRYWNSMDHSGNIDNTEIPIVEFRKENGVVYVKPNPEWIDAGTGLPFPEGTELIYSDMNVKEGDMFPTFKVEDNIVSRQEKKVYALTCALLPKGKKYDALVFCDENGEIDQTMRYIDGIGFYGPEAGVTVSNGGRLNNIYDSDGNIIVEGENVQIPEYVKLNEVEEPALSDVIYTIEGLRVKGAVPELPAGLYIVNGRKVAVRR